MSKEKSLTPVGLTLPRSLERLVSVRGTKHEPTDAETIMMAMWEKLNTPDRGLNEGLTPIDSILHQCDEHCGYRVPTSITGNTHHFVRPLKEEEVRIASATIQWCATNCGRSFLEKFLKRVLDVHQSEPQETTQP